MQEQSGEKKAAVSFICGFAGVFLHGLSFANVMLFHFLTEELGIRSLENMAEILIFFDLFSSFLIAPILGVIATVQGKKAKSLLSQTSQSLKKATNGSLLGKISILLPMSILLFALAGFAFVYFILRVLFGINI